MDLVQAQVVSPSLQQRELRPPRQRASASESASLGLAIDELTLQLRRRWPSTRPTGPSSSGAEDRGLSAAICRCRCRPALQALRPARPPWSCWRRRSLPPTRPRRWPATRERTRTRSGAQAAWSGSRARRGISSDPPTAGSAGRTQPGPTRAPPTGPAEHRLPAADERRLAAALGTVRWSPAGGPPDISLPR